MRTTRIVLFGVLLLALPAGVASAQASLQVGLHVGSGGRTTVDVGFFYDDLAPYGYWAERPAHGWVWTPRSVGATWRPYQQGHWVLTDVGWTWMSDEPFGWATYHYGRWYFDPDYGWSWIPGDEWAPAWVSWRADDDYIGWAPLPPARVELVAATWLFVPSRRFLESRLYAHALPPRECERIYPRTRALTGYRSGHRSDFGVPVDRVRRLTGRAVPRYQLTDERPDFRSRGARVAGNRVAVFHPRVEKLRVAPPPARPVARRSLMTPRIAAETIRTTRARSAAWEREHASPRPTARQSRPTARPPQPERRQPAVHERPARRPEHSRVAPEPRRRPEVRERERPPVQQKPQTRQRPPAATHRPQGRTVQPPSTRHENGRQHAQPNRRPPVRPEVSRQPQQHSRQETRHRNQDAPRPPRHQDGHGRSGGRL